jgi:uncharacterized membrane protein YgaE (UPF0421/DUF939 family)
MPNLVMQSLKAALGSGIAWGLGQALHSPRPFAAVLAVIILMQGHAYGSLLNALQFLLGMAAGLILGLVVNRFVSVGPLVLASVIFVSMMMGGWLKVSRQGFNNQIAVSALLVLASGSAQNLDRLWETALGGAVGVAVAALVWPPNPVRGLRDEYHELRSRIIADIRRTLDLAGRDGDPEANRRQIRANSERADGAVAAIGPAEDALRWNPWHIGRIHDLSRLEDRIRLISYLYRTVRALARQAAESPPQGEAHADDWERSRADLTEAGAAAVEAIELRLDGQDPAPALARGQAAILGFAARAPRDRHALALAAALDDLLTDVDSWRPPNQVSPDRSLAVRLRRRLQSSPPHGAAFARSLPWWTSR